LKNKRYSFAFHYPNATVSLLDATAKPADVVFFRDGESRASLRDRCGKIPKILRRRKSG
jgi:hypothetical protein